MKTAWIFPGGSARAVYTAGALSAVCDMNLPRPDMIIAASGSAPTSVCYLTHQYDIIPKVWLESLSTRRFVNPWRFWKIVNIDYLIDIVLKQRNQLDMDKLAHSDIVLHIPLTDSKTGKIEYISNKTELDMWEVLRASVSVPIYTNLFSVKGNCVGGKFYSDSSPAARFQLHVKKAIAEGATKIVVFDNWHPDDNPTTYFVSKVFASLRNSVFRRNQLGYISEVESFTIPEHIKFIKIQPKEKLEMSRLEIDNANARKIFKRGYEDTYSNKKLREII